MSDYKGFRDVDSTSEQEYYFRFLDAANAEGFANAFRDRMRDLRPVVRGDRILDVGCGLGHEALRLAEKVGSDGQVIGIDRSEVLVAEATRRAKGTALPIEFRNGDVNNIEFPDNAFDLVRVERVLLYLDEPVCALREMARVVRPGGSIIAFDFDFGGYVFDSSYPALTRRIEQIWVADVHNALIGRQLPHLIRQTGLDIRAILPSPLHPSFEFTKQFMEVPLENARKRGEISAEELELWWEDMERMNRKGSFYSSQAAFIVLATKP